MTLLAALMYEANTTSISIDIGSQYFSSSIFDFLFLFSYVYVKLQLTLWLRHFSSHNCKETSRESMVLADIITN